MRKNRNNYQLSRKELNKRLEDMTCNNFRLLSEKKALIDMKEELEDSNEEQRKENKNIKKMMKLNSLIMLLMMDFLNVCNETQFGWGWGIKKVISDYLLGISQEMQELPGDLNPASYDPYDNDEFLDLSDYDEESKT